MTKLLQDMYLNLSDSLKQGVSTVKREENYQKQLSFYRQMYEEASGKDQKETLLVAARCLISLSRSLCENEHSAASLNFARRELFRVGDVFGGRQNLTREDIKQIANKRIARLSKNDESELADSFLFLYMSLLQL